MFKKLRAKAGALAGAVNRGGGGMKVKFELQIVQLERLPQSVKKCRVVWTRSAKVQMTNVKDARNGVALFKQTLVQVSSIHKDKAGNLEPKEYSFKIQVPQGSGSNETFATVGKVELDMTRFVDDSGDSTVNHTLQIPIKIGAGTVGHLKLVINTVHVEGMSEDGMTEVSGMTGMTSEVGGVAPDQDLEGFDEQSPRGSASRRGKVLSPSNMRDTRRALPTTHEEDSDPDSEPDAAPVASKAAARTASGNSRLAASADPFAKKVGQSSTSKQPAAAKPAAKPAWADDDVSPVGSDLSEEEDARPPPNASKRPEAVKTNKADLPPKPKVAEPDLNELKGSLFSKKKPDNPSTQAPASEEEARAALFAAPSKPSASKGKAAAASSASQPANDEDEDNLRNELFTAPARKAISGSAARTAASAANGGKGNTPAPANNDLDEDAARNALFSTTKPKAAPAAASKTATKAPTAGYDFDDVDNEFGDAPAFAAKSGSKPASQSSQDRKPAAGAAATANNAARKGATAARGIEIGQDDSDEDELGVAVPAKSAARGVAVSNGTGSGTNQLAIENERLRTQLQEAQARIRKLEDDLAENETDPAAMFAQLQQMEKQHVADIQQMEKRHAADIQRAQQQHQEQVDELSEHIRELEQQLEATRSEHEESRSSAAAAMAARRADIAKVEREWQAKLDDVQQQLEESMASAIQHQEQCQALQLELEEVRAAGKPKAKTASRGYDFEDDDDEEDGNEQARLIADLRQQITELQRRNEALQQASVATKQEADSLAAQLLHSLHVEQQYKEPELQEDINEDTLGSLSAAITTAQKQYSDTLLQCQAHCESARTLELEAVSLRAAAAEQASAYNSLASDHKQLQADMAGLQAQVAAKRTAPVLAPINTQAMKIKPSTSAGSEVERGPFTPIAIPPIGASPSKIPLSPSRIPTSPTKSSPKAVTAFSSVAHHMGDVGGSPVSLVAISRRQSRALRQASTSEPNSPLSQRSSPTTATGTTLGLGGMPSRIPEAQNQSRRSVPDLTTRSIPSASAPPSSSEPPFDPVKAALLSQLQELQHELKQAKDHAAADRQHLTSEVTRLNSALEATSAGIQCQAALAHLRADRDGLALQASAAARAAQEQQALELQTQLAELQTEIATLKDENVELKTSLASFESSVKEIERLGQQVKELEAELASVNEEKKGLETRLSEFAEAETIIKDWSDYADSLTSQRDKLQAQVAEQEVRLAELEQEFAQLKLQHEQQVSTAQAANVSLISLQSELESMTSKSVELEASNAGLRQETNMLKAQTKTLHATIQALQAELAEQQRRATNLANQQQQQQRNVDGEGDSFNSSSENEEAVGQYNNANRLLNKSGSVELGHWSARGWSIAVEELLAAKQQLEVQVAALRSALATARASATRPELQPHSSTGTNRSQAHLIAAASQVQPASSSSQLRATRSSGHGRHVETLDGSDGESPQSGLSTPDGNQVHVLPSEQLAEAIAGQQRAQQSGWRVKRNPAASHRTSDVSDTSDSFLAYPATAQAASDVPFAMQISQLQEQLGIANSEIVALRALLTQQPLIKRDSHDPDGSRDIECQTVSEEESSLVLQLKDKVTLLAEWRKEAESTLQSLQAEQSVLKVDRAEALQAAEEAEATATRLRAQLTSKDDGIKQLREQIAQLQAELAAAHKGNDAAEILARSDSIKVAVDASAVPLHLDSSRLHPVQRGPMTDDFSSQRGSSFTDSEVTQTGRTGPITIKARSSDADLSQDSELEQLQARMRKAAAMVVVTRHAIRSCMEAVSNQEPPQITEDAELDVAVLHMKNEAVGLFHELKRQAVEAPRFEAQITMAAQRVVELEAQVQELQEENQNLASMQPSVLHGTGLDVASTGMDTPVSMPDVARHSNFRPSPHKAVYADDAAMTISAMEQQLALAESQATEALTSLEQLMEDNVRLRKEVQQLTQELEQRGVSTNFNNQGSTSRRAGRLRNRYDAPASSEEDEDAGVGSYTRELLAARKAGKASLPSEVQQELESLRHKCAAMEASLSELESSSAAERDDLQSRLAAALSEVSETKSALRSAQASYQASNGKSSDDEDAQQLRQQVSELTLRVSQLERENVSLAEEVEEERQLREELEEQVKEGLANMGEDELFNLVEGFEKKYNKLKERYKRLEAASSQDVDDLRAQLLAAQQEADSLRSGNNRNTSGGGAPSRAGGAAMQQGSGGLAGQQAARELSETKRENDSLLTKLVAKQVEVAQAAEQQAMLKRDLYRLKEVNMKLASKMTKLEAQAYSRNDRKLFKRRTRDGSDNGSRD